jgi:hypothetical protein
MLKTRDGQEIVRIFPVNNKIFVRDHDGLPVVLNEDTMDKTAVMSIPSRLTVMYIALNGQVFVQPNVLFYEMQEAFNELSRQAYEAGTSLNWIHVA